MIYSRLPTDRTFLINERELAFSWFYAKLVLRRVWLGWSVWYSRRQLVVCAAILFVKPPPCRQPNPCEVHMELAVLLHFLQLSSFRVSCPVFSLHTFRIGRENNHTRIIIVQVAHKSARIRISYLSVPGCSLIFSFFCLPPTRMHEISRM